MRMRSYTFIFNYALLFEDKIFIRFWFCRTDTVNLLLLFGNITLLIFASIPVSYNGRVKLKIDWYEFIFGILQIEQLSKLYTNGQKRRSRDSLTTIARLKSIFKYQTGQLIFCSIPTVFLQQSYIVNEAKITRWWRDEFYAENFHITNSLMPQCYMTWFGVQDNSARRQLGPTTKRTTRPVTEDSSDRLWNMIFFKKKSYKYSSDRRIFIKKECKYSLPLPQKDNSDRLWSMYLLKITDCKYSLLPH